MKKFFKWIFRLIALVIVCFVGYGVYDYYMADLHNRPDMPPGAFSISYKNGMRVIIVDVPDQRETRRYFGTSFDVPFYIKDSWSFCYPPIDEERNQAEQFLQQRNWPGERFDAICKVNLDGDEVVRGIITTVPKL